MYTGIDWGDLLIAGAIEQQNDQQKADAAKKASAIREQTSVIQERTDLLLRKAVAIRDSKSLYVVIHINNDLPSYNLLMNVEKVKVTKKESTVTLRDPFNKLVVVFRSQEDADDFAESVGPRARLPIFLNAVDSITLNKTTLCSSYADKLIEQRKTKADYEHALVEAKSRCYYEKDVTNYQYEKYCREQSHKTAIGCFIAAGIMLSLIITLIFLAIFDTRNVGSYVGGDVFIGVLALPVLVFGFEYMAQAKEPIKPEYKQILDEEALHKWDKVNPAPSTLDYTAWENDCDCYKDIFGNNEQLGLIEEPACVRQSFSNLRKLPNE